mmetsp:Transcript_27269/g.81202  ORF Transcript_27269/g.81202 Transcript_27269/m.81202 type:complete len:382 (-) Transcript_27269:192-1337(-)
MVVHTLADLRRTGDAPRRPPQPPRRPNNPPPRQAPRPPLSPLHKVLLAAGVLVAMLLKARSSPFYGGAIPAASVKLGGHWDDILRHPSFTRKMCSYTRTTPWWRGGFLSLREKSFREHVEAADIGGEHGHEPEPLDTDDNQVGGAESMAVTRCTSTQFAVTAYFCGLDVAHNRDSAEDAAKAPSVIGGQGIGESEIDKFESWLKAMHALGEARGKHPRYVYRLGVGTEGSEAGYAHVWDIVAQPDGTFYWLQSFVGHYSLPSWMRQSDAKGERDLLFETVLHKLEALRELFRIVAWDRAANANYLRLFNVDMDRARRVDKRETAMHQRLHHFSWDLACGYPAAGHRTEPLDPAAMVASLGVEIAAADEEEEGEEEEAESVA